MSEELCARFLRAACVPREGSHSSGDLSEAEAILQVSPEIAGAIFLGVSSALLGWGVLRDFPHRLPLFQSAPYIQAAILGQRSPNLTAAALMPSLQYVAAAKPTIGIAAWL